MRGLNDKITIECVGCGSPFETYKLLLLGAVRPVSNLCPSCREKKKLEIEQKEKEAMEAEIQGRKKHWRLTCGIPLRFTNKTFDNFEDKGNNTAKIKQICRDYADDFPLSRGADYKSLGLFSKGVWGNGKTHLVCAIAHKVIDRWVGAIEPVAYITEPDMFSRIRGTFNHMEIGETEQDVYRLLTKIPLLIVDDVGKEEVADPRFVQRVWFSLINGRYDNMLPVVITANLTPDEIAYHLGGSRNNEASFDRLYEMVGGVFWENEGKSYRREIRGV